MRRWKEKRTSIEISFFVGCVLFIIVSLTQILVVSRRHRNVDGGDPEDNLVSEENALEPRNVSLQTEVQWRASNQSAIRARINFQQDILEWERSLAKHFQKRKLTLEKVDPQLANQLYAVRIGSIIRRVQRQWEQLHRADLGARHYGESREGYRQHSSARATTAPSFQTAMYSVTLSAGPGANTDAMAKNRSGPHSTQVRKMDSAEGLGLKVALTSDTRVKEAEKQRTKDKTTITRRDGMDSLVEEQLRKANSVSSLALCPKVPESLKGEIPSVNLSLDVNISEVMKAHSDILENGEWHPNSCISRHRVAIIIPYRDRWNHLKVLLHYLLPILKRQQIHFRIFVVEQYGKEIFNKGRIMNAAFREAIQLFDFQCVIFHDVDLVPEDDRNMYSCMQYPSHMSIAIDKFSYKLPYENLVGGVLSFPSSHFRLVNGYSNLYWGWGGEDDDIALRILHVGLRIYRPRKAVARYRMAKHDERVASDLRVRYGHLRSAAKRIHLEGLNSVQYKLLSTHDHKLFTHFMMDIGHP